MSDQSICTPCATCAERVTKFELNEKGGWIVPHRCVIAQGVVVPAFSVIGNHCTLGDCCTLGDGCTIGAHSTLGKLCGLGDGDSCTIADTSTLDDAFTLADGCTIGHGCVIGDHSTIGKLCGLGDCCTLGDGCAVRGKTIERFLTLGNVDGTGRQVKVFVTEGLVMVEAGCFWGSVDEFCQRAKNEDKPTYAAVIRAVAGALLPRKAV